MKKIISLLLVIAMVFCFAACGNTAEEGTDAEAVSVGIAVSTLNNPFFVDLVQGAQDKADELGINLQVADAGDDSAKQASDIEDLVSSGIQVLIVNPCDSDAVAPAVESAIEAGVQVIAVDRVVNGVEVACSIASDNVLGAQLAADYLVSLAGEGAVCAELQGVLGASATVDRGAGFHNVADSKLSVVASQTANFNREEGLSVMEDMLQANPEIACVFAHNDEMALGALEALDGKDVKIAGFDATADALAAVQAGTMAATVAQQPALMGATAVEKALALVNGEAVDASVPVEVALVTAENVADFM